MDATTHRAHECADLVRLLGDVLTGGQDEAANAARAVLDAGFRRSLPGDRVREVRRRHQAVPGTAGAFCACGQRLGEAIDLLEYLAQLIGDLSEMDAELLAADIAELLARYDYPEAGEVDVLPALPEFLARIRAHAASGADSETGADAASWSAGEAVEPPVLCDGPAPEMTRLPWWEGQGVELGSTEAGWFWRCPVCSRWAGPHGQDVLAAKRAGMDHRYHEHDLPKAQRRETLAAARAVSGLLAADVDPLAVRLAHDFCLSCLDSYRAIRCVATAIRGCASPGDVLWSLGELVPGADARELGTEIAAALGRPGWLDATGSRS